MVYYSITVMMISIEHLFCFVNREFRTNVPFVWVGIADTDIKDIIIEVMSHKTDLKKPKCKKTSPYFRFFLMFG